MKAHLYLLNMTAANVVFTQALPLMWIEQILNNRAGIIFILNDRKTDYTFVLSIR